MNRQARRARRSRQDKTVKTTPEMDRYIDGVVREVYAVHFVMMGGGVDTDDIFVSGQVVMNATPPGVYAVVMAKKDERSIVIHTSPLPTEAHRAAFMAAWLRFSHEQPRMPREALDAMVEQTDTFRFNKVQILTLLWEKGFGTIEAMGELWDKGSANLAVDEGLN